MSCDDIIIEVPEEVIVIEMTPEGADGKSLNPRGTWDSSAVYAYRDMVAYQGNSYIALKNVPAGTLPTDTEYWMINAAGGNTTYWGNIHGTLSNQTDLAEALGEKADTDSVYTKSETDDLLSAKADSDSVYTKTEADALLDEKASASSVYTKTETDDLLDLKADKADVYTQAELDGIFDGIDNALDTKADASDVYTKTQTDNLLADKADADDVYTKGEVDTLLTNKADADDVYTKTQTDNLLSAKANSADLGTLASKDTVDYDTEVTNKPTLGTMSAESEDDYYDKTETDTLLSAKANSADLGTMSAESASDYYNKSATDALLSDKADIIHSSASGALVHITDAGAYPVDALTVGIEPVQDLHGYDAPWPAGGGKNLLPKGASSTINGITFTVQDNGEVVVTGTASAIAFWAVQFTIPAGTYIMSGCPANGGYDNYTLTVRDALGGSGSQYGIYDDVGNGSTFTVSESLTAYLNIRIENGYAAPSGGLKLSPMIRLSSIADGTFAPYSNICPISGHTSAVVTRTGKNLWNPSDVLNAYIEYASPNTISASDTTRTVYVSVVSGQTYTISKASGARLRIGFTSETPEIGVNCSNFVVADTLTRTVTAPSEAKYLVAYCVNTGEDADAILGSLQIEVGSTASAYVPYLGETVTVDLDGTRYGGTLDVTTGVLTVTHGIYTFVDISSLDTSGSGEYKVIGIPGIYDTGSGTATHDLVTDRLPETNSAGANAWGYYRARANTVITCPDTETVESFNATMSGAQFVYPLATPLTVQLSPATLSLLLGENNIWSDTGESSVGYRADTKRYIDSKLASAVAELQALILDN